MTGQILDTIGLELEAVINSRDSIKDILSFKENDSKSPIRSITRDASVESMTASLTNRADIFLGRMSLRDCLKRKTEDIVTGYEIVTKPLERREMRSFVRKITNHLYRGGEIYSPRASFHVHVGFPRGLIFQKLAVKLGLSVEPLFYKIAGMGREYRGSINNSAYARPLAMPPSVRLLNSDSMAKLSPRDSINAEGDLGFWNSFGISPSQRDRYVPLRYFAINVYSILLRGTLEYRFFNYTTNAGYMESAIALSQFMCDLCTRISVESVESLPVISIFEENPNSSYEDLLEGLLDLGKYYLCDFIPEPYDIENLRELIRSTPQPIFRDDNILTHLPSYTIPMEVAIKYKLPLIENAKEAGIVDIHNFSKTDRSLV